MKVLINLIFSAIVIAVSVFINANGVSFSDQLLVNFLVVASMMLTTFVESLGIPFVSGLFGVVGVVLTNVVYGALRYATLGLGVVGYALYRFAVALLQVGDYYHPHLYADDLSSMLWALNNTSKVAKDWQFSAEQQAEFTDWIVSQTNKKSEDISRYNNQEYIYEYLLNKKLSSIFDPTQKEVTKAEADVREMVKLAMPIFAKLAYKHGKPVTVEGLVRQRYGKKNTQNGYNNNGHGQVARQD